MSLVCGILLLPFYLRAIILMLIILDVTWSVSLLLGLDSFWGLHWFPGLHVNSLVLLSLPQMLSMSPSLAVARNCYG
jgi:hypothetical protein